VPRENRGQFLNGILFWFADHGKATMAKNRQLEQQKTGDGARGSVESHPLGEDQRRGGENFSQS